MTNSEGLETQSKQEYGEQWQKWHTKREDALKAPYGWLSLRSIDWLEDGKTIQLNGFPGSWAQDGNTVTYYPEANKKVTNRGKVLAEPKVIEVDNMEDVNVEDFYFDGVRAQLIKRLGSTKKFAVRQRDPNSKFRAEFAGLPYFAPDENWVLPAKYVPLDKWKDVKTAAVLSELSHNETQIGDLIFEHDGHEYDFVVFQGHNDDSGLTAKDPKTGETRYLNNRQHRENVGLILFKDKTNGKDTYGGGRRLKIDISEPEQFDHIDFNTAANYPCALSYFCTCPFPPEQNTLPFRVTVGEKTPNVY